MALKLDGRKLASELESRLQSEIEKGISKGLRPPGLAVIRVGDDPASGVYVANKAKACERIGVKNFALHLEKGATNESLLKKIHGLNSNDEVDGILLQLPLPDGLNEVQLLQALDPNKDADGLHALNLGRLLKGEQGPRSCTPAGIMALLKSNKIKIEGKKAVVVGRSILVGQPMALMLQAANATVTVAHSRTKNLAELTKQAEILVVAAGKPQMISSEFVAPNAVVIDVGIHKNPQSSTTGKKLFGDVQFSDVESVASAITPVPGGVGPMTVAMLLVNTVARWQYNFGLPFTLSDLLP